MKTHVICFFLGEHGELGTECQEVQFCNFLIEFFLAEGTCRFGRSEFPSNFFPNQAAPTPGS